MPADSWKDDRVTKKDARATLAKRRADVAANAAQAWIQVSEKASMAVEMLCPAICRGTGDPGRGRPLIVTEA